MTADDLELKGSFGSGQPYRAIAVPVAPVASSPAARAVFLANRRRDTGPEIALRRALFARGLRFLVDVTPEGLTRRRRVDVLFRGSRLAVLVHGCYWHCCPEHFVMPKSNRDWWQTKFSAIRHRDADTLERLDRAGWMPLMVWEHEDVDAAADRIVVLHRERLDQRPRKTPIARLPDLNA